MLQVLANTLLSDEVSSLQAKLGRKGQEQRQLELTLHQAQVSLNQRFVALWL